MIIIIKTFDFCVGTNDVSKMPDSEEWTNSIDRGGWIHVSDCVYMVFVHMVIELQKHLKYNSDTSFKDELAGIINDEVLFYWSMVADNWDETELLKEISQHWITIRGFSYVSAFMENYKQSQKKSTQKAKGLRKTLNTTSIDENN